MDTQDPVVALFGYGNIRLLRSTVQRWLSLTEEAQLQELRLVLDRLHAVHSLKAGPSNSVDVACEMWQDYLLMQTTYTLMAIINGHKTEASITISHLERCLPNGQYNQVQHLAAKFADQVAERIGQQIAERLYPIMLAHRRDLSCSEAARELP